MLVCMDSWIWLVDILLGMLGGIIFSYYVFKVKGGQKLNGN